MLDTKIMHVKPFLKICKIEPFGEGGHFTPLWQFFSKNAPYQKTLKMDYLALEYVHTINIPL